MNDGGKAMATNTGRQAGAGVSVHPLLVRITHWMTGSMPKSSRSAARRSSARSCTFVTPKERSAIAKKAVEAIEIGTRRGAA